MVMYHSVADAKDGWLYRHLSCPVATFESHVKALVRAGYCTIPLQRLYDYMAEGKDVPPRSLVLTFDDGYLDNWVYVFPLLKKYGLQATVFVNPDFVDPASVARPNLEDAWAGRISLHDLQSSGFLSWTEMREMERSGHVDIQSHGLTHTWYFSSGTIVDFHHPGDHYPWLSWNAHPERKYLWMTEDQRDLVPWGAPVYQHEKSLAARRYFPDKDLESALVDHVRGGGGDRFFQQAEWRQQLARLAADYREAHGDQGRLESDSEYESRLHCELAESKRIIEEQLHKRVDFLCWPGGGYNELSIALSSRAGYRASTLASRERGTRKNQPGEDPSRWSRITPPMFWRGETQVEYKGGIYLVCMLASYQGSRLWTALWKLLRLPHKLSQLLSRYVPVHPAPLPGGSQGS